MKHTNRENGRIILLVLITVLALSAFWFIALGVTGSELRIIGGKKSAAQEFFDAEAAINLAMENLDNYASQIYNSATPHNEAITFSPTNSSGEVLGTVTVRTIHSSGEGPLVPGLPDQSHTEDTRCLSGGQFGYASGVKCRLYGIYVDTGSKEIQVGVWQRK